MQSASSWHSIRTVSFVERTRSVENCRPCSVMSTISQSMVVCSFVTSPDRETGMRNCRRWIVIRLSVDIQWSQRDRLRRPYPAVHKNDHRKNGKRHEAENDHCHQGRHRVSPLQPGEHVPMMCNAGASEIPTKKGSPKRWIHCLFLPDTHPEWRRRGNSVDDRTANAASCRKLPPPSEGEAT